MYFCIPLTRTSCILLHILAVCLCVTNKMLLRDSVLISNNFSCYTCRNECVLLCSACMFKALLLIHCFMLCYFVTSAVDEHNVVPHTRTILNTHLVFSFVVNTNYWRVESAYSTGHIIPKQSAGPWLIRLYFVT
jgi:hypothetical protein